MTTTVYKGGSDWSDANYPCKTVLDAAVGLFHEMAEKHGLRASWIPQTAEVIYPASAIGAVGLFEDWKELADERATEMDENDELEPDDCDCRYCDMWRVDT